MNDVAEKEDGGIMDWLRFKEIVPCACVNAGADKKYRESSNAPSKVT
jgi:hypothetical protein